MRDDAQLARAAPHNLDAEQALLGAILIDNDALDRVSGFLEPQHFFDPLHQSIYETASKLIAEGRCVTGVTLKPYFENADPIGPEPVTAYLGRIAANATTTVNVRDYARTIVDLAISRQLIVIGEDIVKAAYEASIGFPPKQQIEEAETRLYSLARSGGGKPELDHPTILNSALRLIDEAYRNGGKIPGISTGLADLNRRIGGLRPGHLVILGGRPSMGKSALAENMLSSCSVPALFFSMEMTTDEVALRELSAETGLPSDHLIRGDVSEEQIKRLVEAAEKLGKRPLIVDQSSGLTIAQVSTKARRAKRQHGIELLVIDYLQLMQGSRRNNRVEDVTEITVGLKALAKELSIPVVALSQLSRRVEERGDKRPQLADLRESGSIEQDADEVLFVYREEYYREREKHDPGTPEHVTWKARLDACRGLAEIIIAKSRHGRVGTVDVQFDGPTAKFSNLAREGAR